MKQEIIPTIEAALASPEDYMVTYNPSIGWTLQSACDNPVSLLITRAEAEEFIKKGESL